MCQCQARRPQTSSGSSRFPASARNFATVRKRLGLAAQTSTYRDVCIAARGSAWKKALSEREQQQLEVLWHEKAAAGAPFMQVSCISGCVVQWWAGVGCFAVEVEVVDGVQGKHSTQEARDAVQQSLVTDVAKSYSRHAWRTDGLSPT